MKINTQVESNQAPTGPANLDERALEAANGGGLFLAGVAVGIGIGIVIDKLTDDDEGED